MIAAAGAGWLVAAWLLWQTSTPDVVPAEVDSRSVFGGLVERGARYERFLRVNWAAATAVELAVLVAAVRLAPRVRLRGIGGGVAIGALTLVAVWLGTLPFVFAGHWWRRRYDVSEASYSRILVDPWLERIGLLAAALAALALLMLLARRLGERWWLPGGLLLVAVAVAYLFLQPTLLTPRTEPLRAEAPAAELRALAREEGAEVVVRDASRRTRAINAEYYGLGPTKRIVVWDTALQRLERDEVVALVAHELGHIHASHALKGIGWLVLFALPGMYVVARSTRRRGGLGQPAAVPVALLTIAVLQHALLPAVNAITRRYEREADWYALRMTADPPAFESLTVKLAAAAVADPHPPAWARIVLETHPTPLERVRFARSLRAEGLRGGS